jgi:hypothetical protein
MSRATAPVERRAFGRRESCIHAVIHVAGRPPLHAIVQNYSEGGALLTLPEPVKTTLPVRLVIESQGIDVVCEVRHSLMTSMGVRFLTAVELDKMAAAENQMRPPAPAEPVTIAELRRKLFGVGEDEEPVIIHRVSSYAGGALR